MDKNSREQQKFQGPRIVLECQENITIKKAPGKHTYQVKCKHNKVREYHTDELESRQHDSFPLTERQTREQTYLIRPPSPNNTSHAIIKKSETRNNPISSTPPLRNEKNIQKTEFQLQALNKNIEDEIHKLEIFREYLSDQKDKAQTNLKEIHVETNLIGSDCNRTTNKQTIDNMTWREKFKANNKSTKYDGITIDKSCRWTITKRRSAGGEERETIVGTVEDAVDEGKGGRDTPSSPPRMPCVRTIGIKPSHFRRRSHGTLHEMCDRLDCKFKDLDVNTDNNRKECRERAGCSYGQVQCSALPCNYNLCACSQVYPQYGNYQCYMPPYQCCLPSTTTCMPLESSQCQMQSACMSPRCCCCHKKRRTSNLNTEDICRYRNLMKKLEADNAKEAAEAANEKSGSRKATGNRSKSPSNSTTRGESKSKQRTNRKVNPNPKKEINRKVVDKKQISKKKNMYENRPMDDNRKADVSTPVDDHVETICDTDINNEINMNDDREMCDDRDMCDDNDDTAMHDDREMHNTNSRQMIDRSMVHRVIECTKKVTVKRLADPSLRSKSEQYRDYCQKYEAENQSQSDITQFDKNCLPLRNQFEDHNVESRGRQQQKQSAPTEVCKEKIRQPRPMLASKSMYHVPHDNYSMDSDRPQQQTQQRPPVSKVKSLNQQQMDRLREASIPQQPRRAERYDMSFADQMIYERQQQRCRDQARYMNQPRFDDYPPRYPADQQRLADAERFALCNTRSYMDLLRRQCEVQNMEKARFANQSYTPPSRYYQPEPGRDYQQHLTMPSYNWQRGQVPSSTYYQDWPAQQQYPEYESQMYNQQIQNESRNQDDRCRYYNACPCPVQTPQTHSQAPAQHIQFQQAQMKPPRNLINQNTQPPSPIQSQVEPKQLVNDFQYEKKTQPLQNKSPPVRQLQRSPEQMKSQPQTSRVQMNSQPQRSAIQKIPQKSKRLQSKVVPKELIEKIHKEESGDADDETESLPLQETTERNTAVNRRDTIPTAKQPIICQFPLECQCFCDQFEFDGEKESLPLQPTTERNTAASRRDFKAPTEQPIPSQMPSECQFPSDEFDFDDEKESLAVQQTTQRNTAVNRRDTIPPTQQPKQSKPKPPEYQSFPDQFDFAMPNIDLDPIKGHSTTSITKSITTKCTKIITRPIRPESTNFPDAHLSNNQREMSGSETDTQSKKRLTNFSIKDTSAQSNGDLSSDTNDTCNTIKENSCGHKYSQSEIKSRNSPPILRAALNDNKKDNINEQNKKRRCVEFDFSDLKSTSISYKSRSQTHMSATQEHYSPTTNDQQEDFDMFRASRSLSNSGPMKLPNQSINQELPETTTSSKTICCSVEASNGDDGKEESFDETDLMDIDWGRRRQYISSIDDSTDDDYYNQNSHRSASSCSTLKTCLESDYNLDYSTCEESLDDGTKIVPEFKACPCMYNHYKNMASPFMNYQ